MTLRPALILALAALIAIPGAVAARGDDAAALDAAKRKSAAAIERSRRLEQAAARAVDDADRVRADAAAMVARIDAAEAQITEAEARVAIVERLRRQQRARLARFQAPLIRLTAALQTISRRPPALALARRGSVDEMVRVRALLASTLPAVRARTQEVRAEVERGTRLRDQADLALRTLADSRRNLTEQRIALAALEARQRERSTTLAASALLESTRAVAFDEEARELGARMEGAAERERRSRLLAERAAPVPRPRSAPAPLPGLRFRLPARGEIVEGVGELSDAGVHARGLRIDAPGGSEVVAPAAGRVAYAGRFRSYGLVLIIDHGSGWTSTVTGLGEANVLRGSRVAAGDRIGRVKADGSLIVELRRGGVPFPITDLIG